MAQNDSLDVLLLDEIFLQIKRVELTRPILLGANLLIDISCNALSKLYAERTCSKGASLLK